jgi:hypothetical protein
MFGIDPVLDAVDLQFKLYEQRQAELKRQMNDAARDKRAEEAAQKPKFVPALKPKQPKQ